MTFSEKFTTDDVYFVCYFSHGCDGVFIFHCYHNCNCSVQRTLHTQMEREWDYNAMNLFICYLCTQFRNNYYEDEFRVAEQNSCKQKWQTHGSKLRYENCTNKCIQIWCVRKHSFIFHLVCTKIHTNKSVESVCIER